MLNQPPTGVMVEVGFLGESGESGDSLVLRGVESERACVNIFDGIETSVMRQSSDSEEFCLSGVLRGGEGAKKEESVFLGVFSGDFLELRGGKSESLKGEDSEVF